MIKKDTKSFKNKMIEYNKYQFQKIEIERKIKNIFFHYADMLIILYIGLLLKK